MVKFKGSPIPEKWLVRAIYWFYESVKEEKFSIQQGFRLILRLRSIRPGVIQRLAGFHRLALRPGGGELLLA